MQFVVVFYIMIEREISTFPHIDKAFFSYRQFLDKYQFLLAERETTGGNAGMEINDN